MSEAEFRFGDILENGFASEGNPTKRGIFIRKLRHSFLMTDGVGEFWNAVRDGHQMVKVGSVLNETLPNP